MEPLKPGDPLAPLTGAHVQAVTDIGGIIFRIQYITKLDQPVDKSLVSPSFIVKSAQARLLAQNLIDAANLIDSKGAAPQAAAPAPQEEASLADLLAGTDFQIKN